MSSAEGIVMPAWADAYRKELIQDVLKDDLTLKSYALVGKRASFPISAKGVQATLLAINGVDTDHATAKGQITQADFVEVCERDPGGETIQPAERRFNMAVSSPFDNALSGSKQPQMNALSFHTPTAR
jgi:hypothetical protein